MSRRGIAIWVRQGSKKRTTSKKKKKSVGRGGRVPAMTPFWMSSMGQGGVGQIKIVRLG